MKSIVSVTIIGLLLSSAAFVANYMVKTKPLPTQEDAPLPLPLVETARVLPQSFTETIVGYGSAQARQSTELTAQVAGEIVQIEQGVDNGSPLAAQQIFLRIDERRHSQAVEQRQGAVDAVAAQIRQIPVRQNNLIRLLAIAEHELEVNRDEETRLATLFEQDLASKKEFDFARLAYQRSLRQQTGFQNDLDLLEFELLRLEALKHEQLANLEIARLDLEHCNIISPFDGFIDELFVEMGERVQVGASIATVVDPIHIEVPIELPMSAYARVQVGAVVAFASDAMPDVAWEGRVERIAPLANEQSRTFRGYVVVDNREQSTPLVAGYFLRAAVAGPALVDALLVPRGAIVDSHVFVAKSRPEHSGEATASRRRIKVLRFLGDLALLESGLSGGESVILTNLDSIEPDDIVRLGRDRGALAPEQPSQANGDAQLAPRRATDRS